MTSLAGMGIGGGFLAAAGAIGGAGKGLAEVGEAQTKMNLEAKMQELMQKREEAITRLQGQQQSGLEEQRAGHEKERVGEEIAGRSAVAHYETETKSAEAEKQRGFAGEQNTQKQKSQEKIAAGHDTARVSAAKAHTGVGKPPPKEWSSRNVNLQGSFDPVSHAMVPGRSMVVQVHRDGSAWLPVGDKLLPYDASKPDGLAYPPDSIRRAPAGAVQALMLDPLGTSPSGMALKDSFANRYHYLPQSYLSVAQAARDKASPPGEGAAAPAGAVASENEEPADPAESEPDPSAPQE